MKQAIVFMAALFLGITAGAQVEYSQWYFGYKAGLDLNGGCPSGALAGPSTAREGMATIADASGNLLMITDGKKVWDASHTIMPNGTGLMGGSVWQSSTQATVIVKQPGTSNQYYVFTTGETESGLSDGFRYTVVDMNAIGNGSSGSPLGDVDTTQKNVLINSSSTERITVCRNGNASGYWIFMHQIGSNRFNAYELTSAGLNMTPVASYVGSSHNNIPGFHASGQMKVNRQETKLAIASPGLHQVQVFDLDKTTGTLSNTLTLSKTYAYSVEFSPNGNLIYSAAQNPNFLDIHQWDLTLSSPTPVLVGTATAAITESIGAMQLAPDPCGSIYIAREDALWLGEITNPDVVGTGCGFVENGQALASNTYSHLGLPQVHSSDILTCQVEPWFDVHFDECGATFTNYTNFNGATEIVGWQWTFGDETSSTEFEPTHYYTPDVNPFIPTQVPGVFQVCLTAYGFDGAACCQETVCRDIEVNCSPGDCFISPEFTYSTDVNNCSVAFLGSILYTNRGVSSWNWDFGDGATGTGQGATHTYSASGTYTVCLTVTGYDSHGNCCTGQLCQQVTITCI